MNSFSIVAVWALCGRNSSCCLVRHSIDLLSCSMARCATARDCGPPSFPSGRPLAPISLPSAIACAKCPDYRSARQIPDSNRQACEASADRRVGSPRPRQARTFTSAPSARSRRQTRRSLRRAARATVLRAGCASARASRQNFNRFWLRHQHPPCRFSRSKRSWKTVGRVSRKRNPPPLRRCQGGLHPPYASCESVPAPPWAAPGAPKTKAITR